MLNNSVAIFANQPLESRVAIFCAASAKLYQIDMCHFIRKESSIFNYRPQKKSFIFFNNTSLLLFFMFSADFLHSLGLRLKGVRCHLWDIIF